MNTRARSRAKGTGLRCTGLLIAQLAFESSIGRAILLGAPGGGAQSCVAAADSRDVAGHSDWMHAEALARSPRYPGITVSSRRW